MDLDPRSLVVDPDLVFFQDPDQGIYWMRVRIEFEAVLKYKNLEM
jgi:hypothetical protein